MRSPRSPRCAAVDASGVSPGPCGRPAGHPGRHVHTTTRGVPYLWGERSPGDPRRRVRRCIQITLAPRALAVLDELGQRHGSRSAAVEAWLLAQAASGGSPGPSSSGGT